MLSFLQDFPHHARKYIPFPFFEIKVALIPKREVMIKKSFQFYKIISLFPFPFILAPTLATLRWIELIWFSLEKEKYVVIQLNHFSGNKLNHNQSPDLEV